MKKTIITVSLILMICIAGGVAKADSFQDGGDRLVDLQNNDGGWDWPLDDGSPANASPQNTLGPIAMGLAAAYSNTGDSSHLAALQNAGSLLLAKTNSFSPSDGYLAVTLDNILGVTTYSTHVKTNYYDKLAAGTYDSKGAGTLYTTSSYVNMIRTKRANNGQANLAAWDIGMGLYSASLIGASTSDWITATTAEIDELDGNEYYDVIGLAGAVMGLSAAGQDYDPTAGQHASASSLLDLANILAGYQLSTGGFTWNSEYIIENDNNETTQETAYALLALAEIDASAFASEILAAGNFLSNTQLQNGGWLDWAGGGENNEITGEALWALNAVPEPATMALLGLGGLLLRRKR